ncbi:MAG TPA: Gfo/Idh/MocA family oxidoreductase [Arenibacter sp.]|nr:Gfo/Idh/MocA family oxidoreductase [Arenibacter sp.]
MKKSDRRDFVKKTITASLGLGLIGGLHNMYGTSMIGSKGKRIGMIGLDTGHCLSFTELLNDDSAGDTYGGYKVVAAYPKGTDLIETWKNRIPEFTEQVRKKGVEIVDSVEELLKKVDVVLITCIDGNKHLEQALPILKAGKPLFVDKPFAASLSDAYAIVSAAKHYNTPMFSSSSLRYIGGIEEIAEGKIGKVLGTQVYSPAHMEEHHPDLFWYGIHGIEMLYAIMGTGCKYVSRTFTQGTDVVVGQWENDRIATYRGIRNGQGGYGGTVFGDKGITELGEYKGDGPLLVKMTEFYKTGVLPVSHEDTLEIFAFMQAAEESKKAGGKSISIESVKQRAIKSADKWMQMDGLR